MTPSPLPDEVQPAPTQRRRLPLFMALGSLVLVLIIVGVIVMRHIQANTQNGQYPQIYASVDDSNATTSSNRLIVLNGRDGSIQWSHPNVSQESIPTIADANVVFFDTKSALQVLNTVDGTTRWSWSGQTFKGDHHHMYVGDSTTTTPQTTLTALDIQDGHEDWRIPFTENDRLLLNADKPYRYNAAAQDIEQLNPQTGAIVWHTTTPIDDVGELEGPFDNMLYTSTLNTLYAIDASSGQVRWQLPDGTANTAIVRILACGPTTVCLGLGDGSVTAVNATTGKKQWSYTFNHPIPDSGSGFFSPWTIADDDTYVVIHTPQNIAVIRKSDGSLAWEKTFATNSMPISLSSPYPIGNGVIYVMALTKAGVSDTMITAFAAATGHILWQAPGGSGEIGSPVLIGNLVVIAKLKVITALDAQTGKVVWSKQIPSTSNQRQSGAVEYLSGAFTPGN